MSYIKFATLISFSFSKRMAIVLASNIDINNIIIATADDKAETNPNIINITKH
ncbi:hypothetical protein ETAE_0320 [Edwardsiella piscicida]|uniref:Uncharacterized protein n=1 Tax=Edwardsiella piscicida TaxID=1263550 RepID=A0AAU8P7L8_EDWPI|nr:hypothetical protein ETAE_0320 [Edwardsiella tarda EIB202]